MDPFIIFPFVYTRILSTKSAVNSSPPNVNILILDSEPQKLTSHIYSKNLVGVQIIESILF